ncbi:MAG: hypothetical protein K5648_09805, partial [Erysipelotrichaceae bacterium]|nr:hypothetical protein [Erysipelotrichaceae bacterium]
TPPAFILSQDQTLRLMTRLFKNNLFLILNELTFCLIASYLVFKDRIAAAWKLFSFTALI